MTTKEEMIAILKSENPTLRVGDEQNGYTNLSPTDYEATIAQWAENRLAKEDFIAANKAQKDAAIAKLAALGLDLDDLKSLGF